MNNKISSQSSYIDSHQRALKKRFFQVSSFALTFLLFASSAFAKTGPLKIDRTATSLASDKLLDFLQGIIDFLQGPIMQMAGIVAVVSTLIMFLVGENQGWFKTGMKILIPIALFTNIGTILSAVGLNVGGAII